MNFIEHKVISKIMCYLITNTTLSTCSVGVLTNKCHRRFAFICSKYTLSKVGDSARNFSKKEV